MLNLQECGKSLAKERWLLSHAVGVPVRAVATWKMISQALIFLKKHEEKQCCRWRRGWEVGRERGNRRRVGGGD